MSRISKGCLPAGRNAAASAPPPAVLRRGRTFAGSPAGDGDEILDLFTRTRRGYQISSSGESVAPNRMETKAPIGSANAGRSGADEFFLMEIGKHDYDWLLTPPGTPLFSSVDSTDHQPPPTAQRSNSNLRPASIVKTSRLSVLQPDNSYHGQRPARSSSTTRASFSTSSRTPSSVLNISSASVNSRPTTPSNRTRTPSVAGPRPAASRPSSPARARPNSVPATVEKPKPPALTSRPSSPARARPNAATATVEKPKPPALTSRPSTPNPRPHFPDSSGPKPIPARLNTRPSTPTRRSQPPAVTPRRPNSPVPRSTAPVQPIIPLDFPLDAPPNLRTKLPERAVSAGRQRLGMALTVRANSNVEVAGSAVSCTKRTSSPAVARGRIAENQAKGRMNVNRDAALIKPMVTEKKPAKAVLAPEVGGYGRTMSKNSLNMALKHMDIRQGMSVMRGGGASLFPHSIRSAATAAVTDRPASRPEPTESTHKDRSITENGSDSNEITSKCCIEDCSEGRDEEAVFSEVKTVDMNLYGSPRYDAMLLKEDARSLNWIHSLDERTDESYPFDHRFEPLPEPFFLMQQSVNL